MKVRSFESVVALALVCGALCGAQSLPAADCNGNGTEDAEDIAGGQSADCNENALPDECEETEPALSFSDGRSIHLGFEPHGSVMEDVDGDGDLDMAVIDGDMSVYVLTNRGAGDLSPPGVVSVLQQFGLFALASADLDNDDDVDLVTGSDHQNSLDVFLNDGNGTYTQGGHHAVGENPVHILAADLSGDGFQDLISGNRNSTFVSVLFNESDGSFGSQRRVRSGINSASTAAGDFDGDGDVDLAVTNSVRGRELFVAFNDGEGGFRGNEATYPLPQPVFVVAADTDNDGDVDLATANASQSLTFLSNNGMGEFARSGQLTTDLTPFSLIAADVDTDGSTDLVTANLGGQSVSVFVNEGDGTFAFVADIGVGMDPRAVVAGDLDGDSDLDLVSANHTSLDLTLVLNQSAATAAESFVERICTEADFRKVSIPSSQFDAVERLTKYIVPADPGDPELLAPLFQNVNEYPLHQEFLAQVFPDRFPALTAATYDQLVGRRATRTYFIGVVYLLASDDGPVYGFNVLASFFDDPQELPTVEEVRGVYQTLSDVFKLRPLTYFPDTRPAREDARGWPEPEFPVQLEEPSTDVSFQVYTQGVGYGRVRILSRGEFAEANGSGQISFQDILILEEAPRDMNGVAGGVMTAEPQGELSHLAVRLARRGTPHAFLADAVSAFLELEGKLIRLQVTESSYTTNEASPEEAEAFWKSHRPRLSELPTLDPDYAALDSLHEMDLASEIPPEARFGGKASNLARLQKVIPPEYQESGFAIPMKYYLDFMRGNTMPSALDPQRRVTLEAHLLELFEDARFQSDSTYRFEVLQEFRDVARATAVVDPDLVERLFQRIGEVFPSPDTTVRFRSSSNVEDALEFNGAGLYESTSVCALDSTDDDGDGPSLCDPDRDNERTIERALKKVWTSLYTFRAYEERAFFGIPQDIVAMGILVNRRFKNEQANGVALTGSPSNIADSRYIITAQEGEESVVSPDPGVVAEKDVLTVAGGDVVSITRAVPSSLVPEGAFVLSDAELGEFGALLWQMDQDFPIELGNYERRDVVLDVEFKIEENGDLAVKQVRPLLRSDTGPVEHVFELEIPPETFACGVFVIARPARQVYELTSRIRFLPGVVALSTASETSSGELFAEVLLGPRQEVATPQGPGTFHVTRRAQGELTTYQFRYEQTFTLPGGEVYQLEIQDLEFQANGAEPLDPVRVVDEELLTRTLSVFGVLRGERESTVAYSSCTHELLPLWQVDVELEDGSSLRLLEKHEPPPTPNDTGPASLVFAEVDLRGAKRTVKSYWDLVYAASRHNRAVEYWVVLEPSAVMPDLERPVRVVEVIAPEERIGIAAAVRYLDADFAVIASPGVRAYGRSSAPGPGEQQFQRGDARAEGSLDVLDALFLLRFLFERGAVPSCRKAADANDDGRLNILDPLAVVLHLFRRGPPLPVPFDGCGPDPTDDGLSCEEYPSC